MRRDKGLDEGGANARCYLMDQPRTRRRRRIVIMGAAGRDFHNFNVVYRDDSSAHVVAFTAAQIPGIAERRYPPLLAGALYPDGIPIVAESALEAALPPRKHRRSRLRL